MNTTKKNDNLPLRPMLTNEWPSLAGRSVTTPSLYKLFSDTLNIQKL